jgi:hypothetical protein
LNFDAYVTDWNFFSDTIDKAQFTETIQVRFRVEGCSSLSSYCKYNDILIDDINIYDLSSVCFPPQNLVLNDITTESSVFNWDDVELNGPVEAFDGSCAHQVMLFLEMLPA